MSWADSWLLPNRLLLQPWWLYDIPKWTLQNCWTRHTCQCAQPWISLDRRPTKVPEHRNHPSLMGWHLSLENVMEGSAISPWDASDRRWCCGGHHDRGHTLASGSSELSANVCHCRLPMTLLHFGLASPDRSIGYWQRALLKGCRPIIAVTPHVSNPHDYVNHMFKRP
jgi:hypothetical protein